MSPQDRQNRQQARAEATTQAMEWLQANQGLVMSTVIEVAEELSEEVNGCQKLAQDAQWAREVMIRLDPYVVLPEPWDTLADGITFLVALAGIGIYRAVVRGRPDLRGASKDAVVRRDTTMEQHATGLANRLIPRYVRAAEVQMKRASHGG
jgi:hypothetical protein